MTSLREVLRARRLLDSIGCSGWQYRHWKGNFYPKEVPHARWLESYSDRFDTVEVNNSFYRLPEATTFENWKARTPEGFLFAVKASRYLTHMKKLRDPAEPISRFFERAARLGRKLGPVLYQLPPRWPVDLSRLGTFLSLLPPKHAHVMEFRENSWYSQEVLRRLERAGVAMCIHDMSGSASPRRAIGPFLYLRFHGSGARYGGRYSDRQLSDWADWIRSESRGRPVFAYFNNDVGGHAPRDAARLRELLR